MSLEDEYNLLVSSLNAIFKNSEIALETEDGNGFIEWVQSEISDVFSQIGEELVDFEEEQG